MVPGGENNAGGGAKGHRYPERRLPYSVSCLREEIMSGRGVSLSIAASAPAFEAASSTSFLALKTATGVSGRRSIVTSPHHSPPYKPCEHNSNGE
jgi:hypothetical protein